MNLLPEFESKSISSKGINLLPEYSMKKEDASMANTFLGPMSQPQGLTKDISPEMVEGAISGLAGVTPAVGAGFKAISSLKPSNLLRGTLSPEQLQRNIDITKGTKTPLGDVIQSPTSKQWFENILAKLPFSGGHQAMQENADIIQQRGSGLLQHLLGQNASENVPQQISEGLQQSFKQARKLKNKIYSSANKLAEKTGFELDAKEFSKLANQFSGAIEDTNMLKFEPEMKKIFSKIQSYRTPNKIVSSIEPAINLKTELANPLIKKIPVTTIEKPTLKEASLLKGYLGSTGRKLEHSFDLGDRQLAGVAKKLSATLRRDIKDSLKSHANENLNNAYVIAEKNYKKEFSPFLEKQVYKYANSSNQADTDLITQAFVKSSKGSDRSNLVKKLVERLSPENKNLVAYDYLSKAHDPNGVLNPQKLGTLLSKLGPRQFKALVPDKNIRNSLINYRDLVKLNPESLSVMFNPKTGQRNTNILAQILAHAGGAALGAFGGQEAQGGPGALVGALAGAVLPGVAARPFVKSITSEKFRENLIKKMINQSKNKDITMFGGA